MGRRRAIPDESTVNNTAMAGQAVADGETVSGYFRRIFKENPQLLGVKSNAELLGRWLADHPGYAEVPPNVKANLANIKSVLRKKRRKGGRPKKSEQAAPAGIGIVVLEAKPAKIAVKGLEALEEQIDDCLTQARVLDRDGLLDVIVMLRRARNAVVWKLGQ